MATTPRPDTVPAWKFALLPMSLGVVQGFIATPLPYLLGRAGVSVDRIADLAALLQIPAFLYFLWAPITDFRFRRRTWLVIASVGGAASLAAALFTLGPEHLGGLTVILLAGLAVAMLVSSTGGALIVQTLPGERQGQASSWYQGGNLGATAAGGGALLWLLVHFHVPLVAIAAVAMTILPALAALSIPEAAPVPSSGLGDRLRKIGQELRALVRSPRALAGAAILASPVGTGAAMGLLPALAPHYGVGAQGVVWINGVAGGFVLAGGSLLGALVPSAWDRRWSYALAGLANAAATGTLLLAACPAVYYAGTILYLLTTGICYARFMGVVTAVVGEGEHGASTRYSLMAALGNLPIAYMTWLDGRGYQHAGAHGLLLVDALGNVVVFVALAAAAAATAPAGG